MGALQLPLLEGRARAVDRSHSADGREARDVRHHQQSFPRTGNRERRGSERRVRPAIEVASAAERDVWRASYIMTRKKRVLGTAGHIDHGKTALVKALT